MTAALTSSTDRPLTRAWAEAFFADGWRALFTGVQHDTTGQHRALTLFDTAGAHPPPGADSWATTSSTLGDDSALWQELAAYGLGIAEDSVELPLVGPDE